jgi:hypothetical protein
MEFIAVFAFLFAGDTHLFVELFVFLAASREPCYWRDERFHPVQHEKQAEVTLGPEESVGGSGKEQGMPSQCSSA